MMWLLAIVFLLVVAWLWFFFGSRNHCHACGVELPNDFAYPGQKVDVCPSCGHRDRT